jgi:hypothetical protein
MTGWRRTPVLAALAAAALLAVAAATAAASAPGARPAAPRVLATGDSMITFVDRELRLLLGPAGAARVVSDIRNATGVTKPWLLDWRAHARRQALRHRPRIVVATMGANDVHPIRGVRCCGARWSRFYAARIEQLVREWRRAGVRHVYWLTLPIQAHARLEPLFTAVNRAVLRVRGVRVVDVRPIVNPGGHYVSEMEVAPGDVRQIRSEDGVHLWHAGARLVAEAVAARLRADGLVR